MKILLYGNLIIKLDCFKASARRFVENPILLVRKTEKAGVIAPSSLPSSQTIYSRSDNATTTFALFSPFLHGVYSPAADI